MDHLLTYSIAPDGIATIIIDQKHNPTNLFSMEFVKTYVEVATRAVNDKKVKGVIITSGQKMFMAGGDLRELGNIEGDPQPFLEDLLSMHQAIRMIETSGKPFVAAINGNALGGGMELCLTCHYRIALNNPKIKLGFPEIKVGLFPGGGGTAKVPYLMGLQTGLM
ncbi:MAG: enoyl-CoA hydratase/isomerase family protein, partial [Bacteroidetes bacterium]|nr:enoyl-CoA hydratase/isomerase family protein [Bacteroidota bacterium]